MERTKNNRCFEELFQLYLPERIRCAVANIQESYISDLEELRIRAGFPLMGVFSGYDCFITPDGRLTGDSSHALTVTLDELNNLFYSLCEHSVYAYQEDIKRGFITLRGGHRAGICGTVVYQGEEITGIRDISSVNIRLSRQLKGCADGLIDSIIRNKCDIYNTLILSPPRCGKTTLLRDIARHISQGSSNFRGLRTAVIDERSEIAANYKGIPQNDLGPRTDILNGCRKKDGIEIALRGMSPHVIIVDELGDQKDAEAIKMAWNAGVRIIATAHAFSLEDFKGRFGVGQLASQNGFERIILLGMNDGERWVRVMDANGNELDFLNQNDWLSHDFYRLHSNRTEVVSQADTEAACTSKIYRDTC
ncbi:MAG: stage III sporulation protein AA [Clostridiaceae bacterium]|nr:stage III sporulation protein AA [Clostridiaceae bacterium]